MAAPSSSLVVRRLYRALLRSSQPFTTPSEQATAMTCLLHRSGIEDVSWEDFLRGQRRPLGGSFPEEDSSDDKDDKEDDADGIKSHRTSPSRKLFRKLLQEVVGGESGLGQFQFPAQVVSRDPHRLGNLIRREFRTKASTLSSHFGESTRREVAFWALRELNKKIVWADKLKAAASTRAPPVPAPFVEPLPLHPPSSYLRPGAYLIAHPNMSGYFRRTVICILDHHQGDADNASVSSKGYGTYGLIINRTSESPKSGQPLTLNEILRPLPTDLDGAFGARSVKEGGPVHMSLQMLHACSDEDHELQLGGTVLSMIPGDNVKEFHQPDLTFAVYYKGDILNAANAVLSGRLEDSQVSFFVGASCWSVGQLESEIERGCWIPCRGPPRMAQTGRPVGNENSAGDDELWLSMLAALGPEEAALAELVAADNGTDECSWACDEFFRESL